VVVNCCVAPDCRVTVAGLIDTETLTGAETTTVAEAVLLVFATLLAITVYVPAWAGAV
jgi:hypothetical protein